MGTVLSFRILTPVRSGYELGDIALVNQPPCNEPGAISEIARQIDESTKLGKIAEYLLLDWRGRTQWS